MPKRLGLIDRIFEPYDYHYKILLDKDPNLKKQLDWFEDIFDSMPLLSLQPLLLGTDQAADFVLKFAELGVETRAQLEEAAKVQLMREAGGRILFEEEYPTEEQIAELVKKNSYEQFKRQEKLFEHAILKESVQLQVELNVVADRHTLITICIFSLALATVFICVLLSLIPDPENPLLWLSNLAFTGVLLVFPTFAFFTYSQLLRTVQNRKEELETKLTRMSAATHAFRTLDQLEIMQQHLDEQRRAAQDFIQPLKVPILNDVAAGLGRSISENYIEGYIYINLEEREYKRDGNYFAFVVDEDSMAGDGIFAGDHALIREQEGVKNGDIAAVVIKGPDREPVGVLKRYYVVSQNNPAMRHWLLESSNPASEHLVVIPNGADVKAIQARYGKVSGQKFEFYEQAELTIVGKYIGVERITS